MQQIVHMFFLILRLVYQLFREFHLIILCNFLYLQVLHLVFLRHLRYPLDLVDVHLPGIPSQHRQSPYLYI